MNRLPEDSFERYFAMGPQRSYSALGKALGVSKRAVSKRARRENWAGRMAKIDRESRERSDEWLADALDEMRSRHLRSLKAIQGIAIQALKTYPLNSASEAVSALAKAITLERLVAGEASTRTEIEIGELTRREVESLLEVEDDDAVDDDGHTDDG